LIGYSSHGEWSTLGRIRELEEERDNFFPDLPYPDITPCIWVCLKAEDCLYYAPELTVEDMVEIEIDEKCVLCNYDYNGGFLLLYPSADRKAAT